MTDPPGNRPPSVEAAAAPKSGNAPLDVLFTASRGPTPTATSSPTGGTSATGRAAEGWRATHTYTAGGTYTATRDGHRRGRLTASATVPITVGNPPGNQAPTVQIAADPAGGRRR